MHRKEMKKALAGLLSLALLITGIFIADSSEAAKKIQLNKTKATVYVGKTVTLKVKGTKKKVTWKTKNKKIATVSKRGVVKGKKAGKVWIQAKVARKTLKCRVTVKKKKNSNTTSNNGSTTQNQSNNGSQTTQTPGGTTGTPSPTPVVPNAPVFSKQSGEYSEAFNLTLSGEEGSTIYYTTDGSVPLSKEENVTDGNDEIPGKLDTNTYTGPIRVQNRDNDANILCSEKNIPYMYDSSLQYDGAEYPSGIVPKATVIRAVVVRPDGTKSKVTTKVYFVGNNLSETYKNASVISIITDPDNLLSKLAGIYRYGNWDNSGDEWERQAEVTYIDEDGTIPFETTMGIRIHGGYSRKWGQKSFRLYFREEYGLKNLKNYQLIPGAKNFDKTADTTKYKKFILRNGGNDYKYTKLQDVWIQSLVEDRAYTTQSARPCVLFLNGEYWGLYNLTERYCDNYLETEFDVDKDNVIVMKNGELDEGLDTDIRYYDELQALADLDMTKEENYKKFTDMVDEESFLDYYATELYIGNKDWPGNNIQFWRTRENDGTKYGDTKWRYMLFDTEYSMDLYGCDSGMGNVINRAKDSDSLFKAVCNNTGFQQKLADTIMDLANNNFEVTSAEKKLDSLATKYRPLMAQYFERFRGGSLNTFDDRVQSLKTYIEGRKTVMQGFIRESFGLNVE